MNPAPLALPSVSRYFPPAVAKVYIVSFRTHDDRRPSKFIVLPDNMRSAIKMAWEHGGADFQSRFDKSTAQAEEMKEGCCAFCDSRDSRPEVKARIVRVSIGANCTPPFLFTGMKVRCVRRIGDHVRRHSKRNWIWLVGSN